MASLDGASGFSERKRGYDMDEVDAWVDAAVEEFDRLKGLAARAIDRAEAADTAASAARQSIAAVESRLAEAEARARAAEQSAAGEGNESAKATGMLALAQKTADAAIAEAQQSARERLTEAATRADELLTEAETRATDLRDEARIEAERLVSQAQSETDDLRAEKLGALRDDIASLEATRSQIRSDVETLNAHLDTERERVREAIERVGTLLDDPGALGAAVVPALFGAGPDDDAPASEEVGSAEDLAIDAEQDMPPEPDGYVSTEASSAPAQPSSDEAASADVPRTADVLSDGSGEDDVVELGGSGEDDVVELGGSGEDDVVELGGSDGDDIGAEEREEHSISGAPLASVWEHTVTSEAERREAAASQPSMGAAGLAEPSSRDEDAEEGSQDEPEARREVADAGPDTQAVPLSELFGDESVGSEEHERRSEDLALFEQRSSASPDDESPLGKPDEREDAAMRAFFDGEGEGDDDTPGRWSFRRR